MTIENLFSNAKKILLSKKAIGIYLGIVNAGSVVATAINIKDLYQTHNPDIFFNLAKNTLLTLITGYGANRLYKE